MGKFNDHEQVAKDNNIGGGTNYWKPQQGENRVRILSEFEVYGNHWIKEDNRSFTCIGKEKGCIYCAAGLESKPVFLMWVLDRKTDSIGLAQIGYQIIKSIGELANSSDWGFEGVPEYDIVITKTGELLKTKYTVTPTPNKDPLTPEVTQLVEATIKPVSEIILAMKKKVMDELPQLGATEPTMDDINVPTPAL